MKEILVLTQKNQKSLVATFMFCFLYDRMRQNQIVVTQQIQSAPGDDAEEILTWKT
jgi:hypothetical protein